MIRHRILFGVGCGRLACCLAGLLTFVAARPAGAQPPMILNGTTTQEGKNDGFALDLEPDPNNPLSDEYHKDYGPEAANTFDHTDTVEPYSKGQPGGASSVMSGSTSVQQSANGYLINPATGVSASIVSTNSNTIQLGAAADIKLDSRYTISGDMILTGRANVYYRREDMQNAWGYFMTWGGTSRVQGTVEYKHPSDPSQNYMLDFFGPDSNPMLATEITQKGTSIYADVFADQPAELSLTLNPDVFIVDGMMPGQGDIPIEDWPTIISTVNVVVNLIGKQAGRTINVPLRPVYGGTPGMGIPPVFPRPMHAPVPAGPAGLLAAAPAAGGLAPGPDNLAQFPFLPSNLYYAVPFPDCGEQTFSMLFGDTFAGITDIAGFGGPVQIVVDGAVLGTYQNGDHVDFLALLGHGVDDFDLISTSPTTPGATPVLKLSFSAPEGFVTVTTPVPEASSLALALVGAAVLAGARRVRRR